MDVDGIRRDAEASGKTQAAAERSLLAKLATRLHVSGSDDLRPSDTVARLFEFWIEDLLKRDADDALSETSIDVYRRDLKRVLELMGHLRLRDVTPGVVDSRIKKLPTKSMRRRSRSHLCRMFDLAVVHAATPSNPVTPTTRYKRASPNPEDIEVMTDHQVAQVRAAVQEWCHRKRPGPRSDWMEDLVDLLLATGCRISEVLAIRWQDIDLTSETPTVSVTGNLISRKGEGLVRVPRMKSRRGERTFVLPPFAVSMLRRRKLASPPNALGAVFITRNGTWRYPQNTGRIWRQIRHEAGLDWVKFHTFRKTVGTGVANVHGSQATADLLGNTVPVAEGHYIRVEKQVVNVSGTIEERFAPKSGRTELRS